jgi:hypothetical protein
MLTMCTIAARWKALTDCFKTSVAVETKHIFSLCHAYHSASHKFVGVQLPITNLGVHSPFSMLR